MQSPTLASLLGGERMQKIVTSLFPVFFLAAIQANASTAQFSLELRVGIAKSFVDLSRDPGPSVSVAVRKSVNETSWWGLELGFVRLASTEKTVILLNTIQVTETVSAGNAFGGVNFGVAATVGGMPMSIAIGGGITTNLGSVTNVSSPVNDPGNQRETVVSPSGGIGAYIRLPLTVLPVRLGGSRLGVGVDPQLHYRAGGGVASWISVSAIITVPL